MGIFPAPPLRTALPVTVRHTGVTFKGRVWVLERLTSAEQRESSGCSLLAGVL